MMETQHFPEGALLAYMDGELGAADAAAAEAHLGGCPACAAEFDAAREISALFSATMHHVDRAPVVGAAQAEFSRRRAARTRREAWRDWGGIGKAAVLVLGLAGVASATLPGSPLRGWLENVRAPGPAQPTAPVAQPPAVEDAATSGPVALSVLPAAGRVRIVITEPAAGLDIRAALSDERVATVQLESSAASPRFRSGAGLIEVAGAGPGELRISLPRNVEAGVVELNGERLLTVSGGQIQLLAPAAERAGAEVRLLIPDDG